MVEYDILGRVKRSTVPTEINANYEPAGDDLARGFLWTYQKYDWKGRVVRKINTDGTDSPTLNDSDELFAYEGCGCAGGQVTTIQSAAVARDDQPNTNVRRIQKVYADILGRSYKTEVMNWDGTTPYTTTVQSFNGRDQTTKTRQYAGAAGSSIFQDVTTTYDGHGRMKTRHYPVEDALTETTWIYNADDSVQQTIDPRGATTAFTYNNRGLVERIDYGTPNPTQIPDLEDVVFTYDATGSRTSIMDGTGTTTYQYDELSRITNETRQFAGLTGNFSIGYSYHIGGKLKTIDDPADATRNVNYIHNKVGNLTAVGGGGYGGVAQYVQNRQARASGAIKQEDYGNGYNLRQEYDTRQRAFSFEIKNVNQQSQMKIEYEYNASSEVIRANSLTGSTAFDRYFKYDSVGQLSEAGTRWDGQSDYPAYSQSLTHDVWGNLISRSSSIWGYTVNTWNTYNNNRNTQATSWNSQTGAMPNEVWQYDASGMPTQTGEQTHKYDAAGRKIESVDTPTPLPTGQTGRIELLIQQTYDGDGQTAKRFEREIFGIGPWRLKTAYYLRSTVLGGAMIAEINEQGQKQKEYVYGAQGEAIASRANGEVRWLHTAPMTGSRFESTSGGATTEGKEYEPLGGEVPIYQPPTGSPDWLYSGTYQSSGNPSDGNGGCQRNGFPEDCSWIAKDIMFGDPRTMNDTVPHLGAGGGMFLDPSQMDRLGILGYFGEQVQTRNPKQKQRRQALPKPTLKPRVKKPSHPVVNEADFEEPIKLPTPFDLNTNSPSEYMNGVMAFVEFIQNRVSFIGFTNDQKSDITVRLFMAVMSKSCVDAYKAFPGIKATPAEVIRDRGITFVNHSVLGDAGIEPSLGIANPGTVRLNLLSRKASASTKTPMDIPGGYEKKPHERIITRIDFDHSDSNLDKDIFHELVHGGGVPGHDVTTGLLTTPHDLSNYQGHWLGGKKGPYDKLLEACDPSK